MSTGLCDTVDALSLASQDGRHRDSQLPPQADAVYEVQPGTLLHLFANSLILGYTAPYLSASGIVNLAATSRPFRALIYGTPSVLRYLDMSNLASANFQLAPIDRGGETWRNVQLDENVTEDDFYSGPLRGTFNAIHRCGWLAGVHTLVLDNLAVTAELVHEILTQPQYNVRILSLRNTKHLNENQLCGALKYACRPTSSQATKLKGLYIFGGFKVSSFDVCGVGRSPSNDEAGDVWYHHRGRVLPRDVASPEWANTLMACRGRIAFDGVLCNGPHHHNSPAYGTVGESGSRREGFPRFSPVAVASHALGGCAGCGSAPEGWTAWGDDHPATTDSSQSSYVSRYPLLYPPPLHTSNLRAAMCPEGESVGSGRFGWTMRRSSSSSSSDGSIAGDWKSRSFGGSNSGSAIPELSESAESPSEPARFIARCECRSSDTAALSAAGVAMIASSARKSVAEHAATSTAPSTTTGRMTLT